MSANTSDRDPAHRMTRRQLLARGAALGGALAAGRALADGGQAARRRPNLLFVFSDQQSWDMLGCYGNEQIITPNLDRFAGEGVRFDHCVSNAPVCTPYRSMLLTGQHPLKNGCLSNDIQLLTDNGPSIAEVLRDAGYRTAYVGKWHLFGGDRNRPIPAGPHRHGFDDLFASNNCHVDFRPGNCYYWTEEGEKVFFDEWEVYGQTRQALRYLDTCTEDEPFALFVSWHPPHDWGKYEDGVWRYDTIPELMELYDPDKIRFRPNFDSTTRDKRSYHGYMAMCSGVDRAFGWLVDKLTERGLAEDTLVVFTSDHGDLLGSHNRPFPKTAPEDEACRVPLLMRLPGGLRAGSASELLIGSLDLMPTLLSLMGFEPPATCDGLDLSAAAREGREDVVESVPLFMPPGNWRGVFTREHTYSVAHAADRSPDFRTLYCRRGDRYQMHNRFGEPAYRSVQAEMDRLTREWMARYDDTLVPFGQVMDLCMGEGKRPTAGPGDTGELLGRPVDLLRAAGLA
jgi:arylsulfatase A-like enzyme